LPDAVFPSRRDEAAAPANSASVRSSLAPWLDAAVSVPLPSVTRRRTGDSTPAAGDDETLQEELESYTREAPGAEEMVSVPWPLLLRQRATERIGRSDRYRTIVLTTLLFGLFSVGFTITVLANSIPRIADDLNASESTISWVTTAPLLAFAVFGPAAGKIADLRGHRRVYLVSLAGVAVFAGLTALAPTAGTLILCRVAGATIGAAVGPASLAMINRLFPADRRAQAMGWWSMVGAGGPVVGLVVGGPVVEAFGWRWIFVAQVPLTLVTLLVSDAVLPDTRSERVTSFDLPGAATLGLAALSLLFAVNRGPSFGWSSPVIVGGFVFAALALAVFVWVERRVEQPLLPLRYARRRNFSSPLANQLFGNFAYMGGFILTPLFLQHEFGYSESHSSLLLIARPLTFAIAGPIAGFLTLRVGERSVAVFGAATLLGSMFALAAVQPGATDLFIIGALALSGIGMGASSPAMAAAIANSVDDDDLGVVGATHQMVGQIGAAIGMQVMIAVQVAREPAVGGVTAYHDAYLVGAAAAALSLVAAAFVRSGSWARRTSDVGQDARDDNLGLVPATR
jgi:EmrB/QacA subfamily drug resistance transporter